MGFQGGERSDELKSVTQLPLGTERITKERTDDVDEGLLVWDGITNSGVDVLEVEGELWGECWCHGVNVEGW